MQTHPCLMNKTKIFPNTDKVKKNKSFSLQEKKYQVGDRLHPRKISLNPEKIPLICLFTISLKCWQASNQICALVYHCHMGPNVIWLRHRYLKLSCAIKCFLLITQREKDKVSFRYSLKSWFIFFFIEVLKIMSSCKFQKKYISSVARILAQWEKVFAPKTLDLSWNAGHPRDWRRKQAPNSCALTYIGKLWHVYTCTLMHKHTHN